MIVDALRCYILVGLIEVVIALTVFSTDSRIKLHGIRKRFKSPAAFWLSITIAVSLYSLVWLPWHVHQRLSR